MAVNIGSISANVGALYVNGTPTVTWDTTGITSGTANCAVATATTATKWNGANKTVSTAAPSGGSDGDIWFVRAA